MIYKNAELYNVAELISSEQGVGLLPVRIPNALRLKLNDSAKNSAIQSAGCELRFILAGDVAEVTLVTTVPNNWNITHPVAEIYQGGFQAGWQPIGPEPTTLRIVMPEYKNQLHRLSQDNHFPYDAELTRIVLPYRPQVRLIDLKGDLVPPRPDQTPAQKYLAYGSSITHGHVSVRPTETWAMQTARALRVDLINLGFGGGAHLEPEMADYIAGRKDWNFATLEMGINMLKTFSVEEFAHRVDYFITRIAEAHPEKWIFCIDMFLFSSPEHLDLEREKDFRSIVRNKVAILDMPRLKHIPGIDLLNQPDGLTADLVHPSPAGMTMIADNIRPILEAAKLSPG